MFPSSDCSSAEAATASGDHKTLFCSLQSSESIWNRATRHSLKLPYACVTRWNCPIHVSRAHIVPRITCWNCATRASRAELCYTITCWKCPIHLSHAEIVHCICHVLKQCRTRVTYCKSATWHILKVRHVTHTESLLRDTYWKSAGYTESVSHTRLVVLKLMFKLHMLQP